MLKNIKKKGREGEGKREKKKKGEREKEKNKMGVLQERELLSDSESGLLSNTGK